MGFSPETQIFQFLSKVLNFISLYYFITNVSVTEHFYCPRKCPSCCRNLLKSNVWYAGSGTQMNKYLQLHTGLPELPVLLFPIHFSFTNGLLLLKQELPFLLFFFLLSAKKTQKMPDRSRHTKNCQNSLRACVYRFESTPSLCSPRVGQGIRGTPRVLLGSKPLCEPRWFSWVPTEMQPELKDHLHHMMLETKTRVS